MEKIEKIEKYHSISRKTNIYKMCMRMNYSNVNNITQYCKRKSGEKVEYVKQSTGGNDPSISKRMRYSQIVRNNAPKVVVGTTTFS